MKRLVPLVAAVLVVSLAAAVQASTTASAASTAASAASTTASAASTTASAASTTASPASRAIGWLNAQRVTNGIPGDIVENPDWSAKCDKHITYMQKTGYFDHFEDPSSPFYSEDGEWGGTNSVLAAGTTWAANRNPWETAPIHLAQLLDPQLSVMGVADRDGYVCATTWPGYQRPLPDQTTVVTYPGANTAIYAREVAAESPFTPGEIVGLPVGAATGPHLYVYLWGPVLADYWTAAEIRLASAELTGPQGSVPVKWVDQTTPQIGAYLPNASGIVIPLKPLRARASYQADVRFTDGTAYSWTFRTRSKKNKVELVLRPEGKGYVSIVARSLAPAKVSVRFHGRSVKVPWLKKSSTAWVSRPVKLSRGTRICLSSGGGDTEYSVKQLCKSV